LKILEFRLKKLCPQTKFAAIFEFMSKHSAKTAGRSAKATRQTAKKGAKSIRATAKKVSKSARLPVANATRPARTGADRVKATNMIRTPSPPVQPVATAEIHVRSHKYQVGETVYYTSPTFGRAAATGSYIVVKLLPSEGDDYQYRIKSSGEAFERVAKESQLDRP
jgi:hypothetical protein